VSSLIMAVAVPVPIAAIEAEDRTPFEQAALPTAMKRITEGLRIGSYRRVTKLTKVFATRAQYEGMFPAGKMPELMPEVEAVLIASCSVEPR